jgi:hypothetical protein
LAGNRPLDERYASFDTQCGALRHGTAKQVRAHNPHTPIRNQLISRMNRCSPSSGPRTVDGLSYFIGVRQHLQRPDQFVGVFRRGLICDEVN